MKLSIDTYTLTKEVVEDYINISDIKIRNIQGDRYRLKEKKEMGQLGLDLFKNNDNSTENIEKN